MVFLNDMQKLGLKSIIKFINCSNGLYYLLDGAGGCGKTTLIKEVQHYLKKNNINHEILAPTNKACNVLKSEIPVARTLSQFLGFKIDYDENGNEVICYSIKKYNGVLVIDECSMIKKEELNILKGFDDTKIIFVGDECQINPVNEEISEIYNLDFWGRTTLIENMRTGPNKHLTDIALDIRQCVIDQKLKYNLLKRSEFLIDKKDIVKYACDKIKNKEEVVILTYTNKASKFYRDELRRKLFNVGDDEELKPYYNGEILVTNKFMNGIKTDTRFQIQEVSVVSYPIAYELCECKPFKRKCQVCGVEAHVENFRDVKFYEFVCKNLQSDDDEPEVLFRKPYDSYNLRLFNDIMKANRISLSHKKNFYTKERAKKKWKEYFSLVDECNSDVSHIYSQTIHKAQGSGYDTVIVDIKNTMFSSNKMEKLRLIYTGVSRARKELKYYYG